MNQFSIRKINALYEAGVDNLEEGNKMLGVAVRIAMNADQAGFDRWLKG